MAVVSGLLVNGLAVALGLSIRHTLLRSPLSRSWPRLAVLAASECILRLLVLGLAPLTNWNTAALIGGACGIVLLQRLTASKPLLHVPYLMPLLALLSVPIQLGSARTSTAMLMTGLLYLLMRHTTRQPLPLYLGVLAINLGIYLWVSGWAEQTNLVQMYFFPAALSVLILLHLHRRELRPSVLHSTRLAAIVLMAVGAAITAAMVWFNMKREAVLKQIRIVGTGLERWD